jgi:hypothetical protein
MTKREFLGHLGLVAVGGGLALVGRDIILERDADRRFALYNIMRELRKGMSRGEVDSIINRHDAPYIRKDTKDESIFLSVKLGGINMLYVALGFATGKLIKAKFGGEDNPWDVPKDAPPNIE